MKARTPEPIGRRRGTNPVPLSAAQKRFWILHQFDGPNPFCMRPLALRLRGPLDDSVLCRSLNEILRRHEVLRSIFPIVSGEPMQALDPANRSLELHVRDLRQFPDRETQAQRIVAEDARIGLDLARGPLIRANLLRLGKEHHVLLLILHHIVFDGWSEGILSKELRLLYEAFIKGEQNPVLPELPIQYADYALWQHERLSGGALKTALDYWRNQLEGLSPLHLPADHPGPKVFDTRGARHLFTLSSFLTESLKELSRREGATLFMTLLAAFQVLLGRHSGQQDFAVGAPIAGRTQLETENLIGCFINNLIYRAPLSGNPSFRQALARVKVAALAAYGHQEVPFEALVEELRPERAIHRWPFFQVLFNFRNLPTAPLEHAGPLSLEPFSYDAALIEGLDLILEIAVKPGGLSCEFIYSPDLFEPETIERLAEHFRILLDGIVANPEERISDLALLAQGERRRILVAWNETKKAYPSDACVHHLFEKQVEKNPDAVAIMGGDRPFTYGELNQRANQLAHYLKKFGVGPETLVGISVEKSPEMVVGLLGILKAGGAYVPVDPGYPRERREWILTDARAGVVVTQRKYASEFRYSTTVCLDGDWEKIAREDSDNPNSGAVADHLVYVVYTSGSTGTPKGVLVTHRSLVNVTLAEIERFEIRSGDRRSLFSSLGFDVAAAELFTSLATGATSMLPTDGWFRSIADFHRFVSDANLTVVSLPTAFWHEWVHDLTQAATELPPSLRLVIVGTEQASPVRFAEWQKLVGDRIRWCNAYGPTEATITATIYEPVVGVAAAQDGETPIVPIGRPIANTQIYLLDRHLNPVPVGVAGELHIGGTALSRGYIHDAALTAAKFIPHPYAQDPGERLYSTGDRARYLPDGNIEFLGRGDDQMKIRGYRVELGEIEAVLRQQAGVREAVVIARDGPDGGKQLVAYVVASHPDAPINHRLRNVLKEKLPAYMVPSIFAWLDALPLDANGKIDRKRLPDPETAGAESAGDYAAPQTPGEQMIAAIWRDALMRDGIGIHDDFFALGGHSLLAMRVISRISAACGVELSLGVFFANPTVAGLAIEVLRRQLERFEEGDLTQLMTGLEGTPDEES